MTRNKPSLRTAGVFALALSLLSPGLTTGNLFAQEDPEAPETPETIDLRVDGDPLLLLFERIARDLRVGLVANSEISRRLREEVTIEVAEARWDDAVELFALEYNIAMRRVGDRLVLSEINAEFRKLLTHRTYSVGHLVEHRKRKTPPPLGYFGKEDHHDGGGGLLNLAPPTVFDELSEIIPAVAGRGTWDREGVALLEDGERLHIRQIPAVHREIEEWLKRMEEQVTRQVVCRVHKLPPGEYAEQISGQELAELTEGQSPIAAWIVPDSEPSFWFSGQDREYVSDLSIIHHVAGPVIEVLRAGWLVQVEPHVTRQGVLANIAVSHVKQRRTTETALRDETNEARIIIQTPQLEFEISKGNRMIGSGEASVHQLGSNTVAVQLEVIGQE